MQRNSIAFRRAGAMTAFSLAVKDRLPLNPTVQSKQKATSLGVLSLVTAIPYCIAELRETGQPKERLTDLDNFCNFCLDRNDEIEPSPAEVHPPLGRNGHALGHQSHRRSD